VLRVVVYSSRHNVDIRLVGSSVETLIRGVVLQSKDSFCDRAIPGCRALFSFLCTTGRRCLLILLHASHSVY
jgi:hypothetical protein